MQAQRPNPMKTFQRKIFVYARIDQSQSLKGQLTDLIGQFQRRVKSYIQISL